MDIFKLNVGDKVEFTSNGMKHFWFTALIKNGRKLKIGQKYTISSKYIYSSWVKITLDETGDLEYSLSWFK